LLVGSACFSSLCSSCFSSLWTSGYFTVSTYS
jgi:hypothetical protein